MTSLLLGVALAAPNAVELGREEATPLLAAAATTEALGTMELRAWHPIGEGWFAGGGLDLPVTLWARSGVPDTLRASGSVDALLFRRQSWLVIGGVETRVGVQHTLLGTMMPWDVRPSLGAGSTGRRGYGGLRLAWEQPLMTALWFSDFVDSRFEGQGMTPPRNGVVPVGMGRLTTGLEGVLQVSDRVGLLGGADVVLTPDRMGLGLATELVAGVLPVFVEVGVVGRLR